VTHANSGRARHLRLVAPTNPAQSRILQKAADQREFVALTQRLVDIAIEIADIVEGDPDMELSGDENEDSDGI
jgi:hypothetical protein